MQQYAHIQGLAPDFRATAWLCEEGFKEIKCSDYKGKYLVLFFYPMDFTFVCPTEILTFSEKYKDFKAIDCEIIGCSIDSQFVHMAYTQTPRDKGGLGPVTFPLLSDITHSISKSYRALIEDGPDSGVCSRSTYIIDRKGIIRHVGQNDLSVGRNVDEIFRLVQAFQHVDENGVVCPSGWKKGGRTLKADHKAEETKKYWEEEHVKHK